MADATWRVACGSSSVPEPRMVLNHEGDIVDSCQQYRLRNRLQPDNRSSSLRLVILYPGDRPHA